MSVLLDGGADIFGTVTQSVLLDGGSDLLLTARVPGSVLLDGGSDLIFPVPATPDPSPKPPPGEWDIRLYNASGRRLPFDREQLESLNFTWNEKGGYESGQLTTISDWNPQSYVGTEYFDIWAWNVRVFRGWAKSIDHDLSEPTKRTIKIYGLQQKLNQWLVRRQYCFAVSQRVDQLSDQPSFRGGFVSLDRGLSRTRHYWRSRDSRGGARTQLPRRPMV